MTSPFPQANLFLTNNFLFPLPMPSISQNFHASQIYQENFSKKPASSEFIYDPTKRVRHTEYSFTQNAPEITETNFNSQVHIDEKNLKSLEDRRNLLVPVPKRLTENYINRPDFIDISKHQQLQQVIMQRHQEMIYRCQLRQQLLQQLGYQQSDQDIQQLLSFNRHLALQLQQSRKSDCSAPLMPEKELYFSSHQHQKSEDTNKKDDGLEEKLTKNTDFNKIETDLMKYEDLAETISSNSSCEYAEKETPKTSVKKLNSQIKNFKKATIKRKYISQARLDRANSRQILSSMRMAPTTGENESRRKNKWQLMAEQKPRESSQQDPNSTVEDKENKNKQMEEDANIDYDYLLSITITNDPAKTGNDNSSQDFIVITRDTPRTAGDERNGDETKNTRVGSRYQAVLPEVKTRDYKTIPRRKSPESVWNPDMIHSNVVDRYLEAISESMKLDFINQEKALKLLKRKNYQSEKVLLNITKNEKFYSNHLAVGNGNLKNVGAKNT